MRVGNQRAVMVLCALGWLVLIGGMANALSFNFVPASGTSQDAVNAFAQAGARWSALFADPVTVNININFTTLGTGILGSSSSSQLLYSYSSVRNALLNNRTSANDYTAAAHIPTGSSFGMLINRTSNSPYGAGSATPYLDNNGNANNSMIMLSRANAKALGLIAGSGSGTDAYISFSSAYKWDFNPADGITAGTLDFVGIATHEIGHSLGFISGVDVLDRYGSGAYQDGVFSYVSPLDLFRYSSQSTLSGVIDWTADKRAKYFSIDGGVTSLGLEALGVKYGDGRQASHWKNGLRLGIMNPTVGYGQLMTTSNLDIEALDVIGWDQFAAQSSSSSLASAPSLQTLSQHDGISTPEPETIIMIATALAGLVGVVKKRIRK